jgi:hypothetical protein
MAIQPGEKVLLPFWPARCASWGHGDAQASGRSGKEWMKWTAESELADVALLSLKDPFNIQSTAKDPTVASRNDHMFMRHG